MSTVTSVRANTGFAVTGAGAPFRAFPGPNGFYHQIIVQDTDPNSRSFDFEVSFLKNPGVGKFINDYGCYACLDRTAVYAGSGTHPCDNRHWPGAKTNPLVFRSVIMPTTNIFVKFSNVVNGFKGGNATVYFIADEPIVKYGEIGLFLPNSNSIYDG